MRAWWACLSWLVACGDTEDPATTADAGGGGAGGEPLPTAIADHAFGGFAPWAAPIEDYKAVGEMQLPGMYDPGLKELTAHEGRLWIGYGDGNYNMGTYTPIELRFFASAEDPAHAAAIVSAEGEGAPQDVPTRSGEEAIDRYRLLDGRLWQAGVDSIDADELHTQMTTTPPGIEGNCYVLDGDVWQKHRSIVGGEHVHDFAAFGGAVYGVGSGADNRMEFEAGQIFRYLWRSDDLGATFTTVERIQHPMPGGGDTRFVHLLATADHLFLFGYESDFMTGVASIRNASYESGATTTPLDMSHDLARVFGLGTLSLPDGTGLVHGVDVAAMPLVYALWHVAADGSATRIDLGGKRVLDIELYGDEVLYLTAPGDAYPAPDRVPAHDRSILVGTVAAPGALVEAATYQSPVPGLAIAFWEHALFLGTGDGQVLKAIGEGDPPAAGRP
jgi:hypothetical protein